MRTCGIVISQGMGGVRDLHGCCLDHGHDGPHEFVDTDGTHWHWETDFECGCDHCMRCEGDYCFTYWKKPIP